MNIGAILSVLKTPPEVLKTFAIIAIVAAPFYVAWNWRGSIAESEKSEAVKEAIDQKLVEIQTKLDEERAARAEFQAMARDSLRVIAARMEKIRAAQEEVGAGITEERRKHKDFYDQPLTDGGRAIWMKARKAAEDVGADPQPSGLPASQASPR